jgi:hypothetical protein
VALRGLAPSRAGARPDRTAWPLAVAAVVVAALLGAAVARGGVSAAMAVAVGGGSAGAVGAWALLRRGALAGLVTIEVPVLLLLLSTLVLRQRDAASLAANPLDLAGLYRVLCIGLALLLGGLSLTHPNATASRFRFSNRSTKLYVAYVAVVFLGALPSVDAKLTAYRAVELAAGVIVIAGAVRSAGDEAPRRILRLFYGWYVLMALSVWAGVVLMPEFGIQRIDSPIPYQIQGALPVISANGTGTIGAILAIWSFAVFLSPREEIRRSMWTVPIGLLGFVTLIFAQYRTGYAALALGVMVILGLRKRGLMAVGLVIGVTVTVLWGSTILREAEPVALRGQSVEEASQLSGRLNWWELAIPVWRESPVIGKGLLTATRFEVLATIGRTNTSTIHGTWVEALVGTGIVGIALLACSFLIFLVRAFREGLGDQGRLAPAALGALLLIRSLTGPTFESFGDQALFFLILSVSLPDPGRTVASRRDDA